MKYFKRNEFACKCGCGFDTIDVELAEILEELRTYFNSPITINSACRCATHNASVGGKPNSQHLYGRAADIVVEGIDPIEVQEVVEKLFPNSYGLGRYNTFTHIDSRSKKARW